MMIRLLCLGLLFSSSVYAQTIKGTITDATTNEPLIGVNISIDGTTLGTSTDEKGAFSIRVPGYPSVLTISYLGYKKRKIALPEFSTQSLNIQLTSIASELTEIVVSAEPQVEVIYKESYSVLDYEFYDQYVLLLVYKGYKKREHLLLMDENGEILDDISLKGKTPDKFFKSCLGGIHLMFGFYVRQLYVADEKIYFVGKTTRTTFEDLLSNCALATPKQVYFFDYFVMNQMLDYFFIEKKDKNPEKTKHPFTTIADVKKIRMAYDEGRFQKLTDNFAAILGRPRSFAEIESDQSFLSRVVYEPIYAPLFGYKDSLCLFSHINNQIEVYTPDGTMMRSVNIDYHRQKKWKEVILQDETTQLFYTLFKSKWGFEVKKVNPLNGKVSTIYDIKYLFADNFKVKDGYLYFLFNNPRINQPKYKLHKVRIE